jgi:dolichol-phosphate mannosyltransferase
MRPLVIVPTYNERDNLPVVVARLLEIPDVRVLVVDDASPDGTGAVADTLAARSDDRVSVLHRTGPRGLGLSYIDGIRQAFTTDATHICQMDADLSHDPADVARLLAALRDADMVIGSRYIPGGRIENWPARRKLLSAFANRYVRAITGLRINDCTSGFRCWRREALQRFDLDRIASNGYAFVVEMTWEAVARGCRVIEVPITFVERRLGASKLSGHVVAESAIVPWRLAWRSLSRKSFRATI